METTEIDDFEDECNYEDMSPEESKKAAKEWNDLCKENDDFIAMLGELAVKHFKDLIADCYVTDKIKFVETPKGARQHEEFGPFKDVHVRQVCHFEDDYSGQIYAKIAGRWIEIPFHC